MTFINEFIPPEDVEKFHLDEIDKGLITGIDTDDWTVDRERNIYLRKVAAGGGSDPDLSNRSKWTLYWKSDLLILGMEYLEGTGERGQPGWSHWLLVWVNGSNDLPASLKVHKAEFLADLEEALTAYQGGGVYSANYTDYSVTLDIAQECVL
jgi:hypothetical protein